MQQEQFGMTRDGKEITAYTLQNKNGLEVRCINYGCRIVNVYVPAENGTKADVILGYDTMAEYEEDTCFMGTVVGRVANRIGKASFKLGDKEYKLPQNDGENYLHGSLHSKVFSGEAIGENSVTFTYVSPDGEDGFPGEVWYGITYTLTDDNELMLDYRALTDTATHINITNHGYFNLAADGGDILDHSMLLNGNYFLEVDSKLIPTGQEIDVRKGSFDFTQAKRIGQDIEKEDPQLALTGGYDHCYILNRKAPGMALAADVVDPKSKRGLRVYTTQPAVQFYTGNFLTGTIGKGGKPMNRRAGLCLETQHYPDSPNQPEFPSTLVRPKEKYHQATIWHFYW